MNEQEWRAFYKSPGGIATCMSPAWLLNGCPKCGCKTWQVTSDCWAYCDKCYGGFSTAYPFTSRVLVSLPEKDGALPKGDGE